MMGDPIPGAAASNQDRDGQAALTALRSRRSSGALATTGEASADGWLTTYTDMVTLLLTLFIFLVAMSDFHGNKPKPPPAEPAPVDAPAIDVPPPAATDLVPAETVPPDLEWLRDRAAELEDFAVHNDLAQAMTVERTERALVIQLRDGILFDSARADLTGAGQAVVRRLAGLLADLPGEIEVEGHTDAVPIETPRFPSNWELSAARAAAVVRKLIDNGVPAARVKAVGYADTRPVAENATAEGRAANRRVALLILARSVDGVEHEDR